MAGPMDCGELDVVEKAIMIASRLKAVDLPAARSNSKLYRVCCSSSSGLAGNGLTPVGLGLDVLRVRKEGGEGVRSIAGRRVRSIAAHWHVLQDTKIPLLTSSL